MTSAVVAGIDQLIVSGSNFLIVMLAARFLGQEDVAKYAYTYGFFVFCSMLAYAWIYQNLMVVEPKALIKTNIVKSFAGLNLLLAVLSIPFSLIAYSILVFGQSEALWSEAIFAALFVALNQIIDFERRILYFVPHSLMGVPFMISGIGFILRVIALVFIQPESFSKFILCLLLFSIPGVLVAARRISFSIYNEGFYRFLRQQISDGKWMTVNIPINWAWGQAPIFLVGSTLGLHAGGVYAAIRGISNIGNVAMELVPTYVASRLSKLFTSRQLTIYRKYIFTTVTVGLFLWGTVLTALFWFGEQIIGFSLGENYSQYASLLSLLWAFNALVFLNRFLFLHLRFIAKTSVVPVAHLLGASTLATSFCLFFKGMGIAGMAWAMIIGGAVIVLCQTVGVAGGNVVCKR